MWIEAGDMSGGSRNQIEFDEDLAKFFTEDLPMIGDQVELQIGVDVRWLACGLAAKRTSYGVDIYRLSLPTVARGGHDYAGQIVRFDRSGPIGSRYFQVTVVENGSDEHNLLKAGSQANATLSSTSGSSGREFGYL